MPDPLHKTALLCFTALLFVAPAIGAGQLYRWVDDRGVVHYSERLPTEATGKAAAQLSSQGTVVKHHAAALTSEQLAAQAKAQRDMLEAEKRAREEKRKNEALLKTYASEQDIDDALERALANNGDAIRSAQHKVAQAEARQADLKLQAAAFEGKRLPAKLERDIESSDIEVRDQRALLDAKRRAVATITSRYDEDRRRYIALTRGKQIGARVTSADVTGK